MIARAVGLLHEDPARPWTLAVLASTVGISRAALARRFHAQVGQPPMTYLARWRLALAADRLADSDATVAAIAREVGYSSPFSFSMAFKKHYAVSPRDYRARTA